MYRNKKLYPIIKKERGYNVFWVMYGWLYCGLAVDVLIVLAVDEKGEFDIMVFLIFINFVLLIREKFVNNILLLDFWKEFNPHNLSNFWNISFISEKI